MANTECKNSLCHLAGPTTPAELIGVYKGLYKSFRTESITKCTLTTINTRREATQRVSAAKLTWLTHKIVTQLHLVAEGCTISSSHSRWPVRKLLDTS